jgi:hypothetical protein
MPIEGDPVRFLDGDETSRLYRVRFDERTQQWSAAVWGVLCRHFFQRYVPEQSVVVDLEQQRLLLPAGGPQRGPVVRLER